ncbi:MAG: hypothetical protein JJU42_12995 [Rhodobacteraceae bacterium]|nr:hypothetical protein [Paracoccaceae bacterium]
MANLDFPSEQEIDEFASGFFGYGEFEAPLWFIGMEEGGGKSASDVARRIRTWQERGRAPLEDVAKYHDAILRDGFKSIRRQNTWSALSRIHLSYVSSETTGNATRNHWQKQLGRWGSLTCMMELNPLPSPGITAWNYPSFTEIPFLASRVAYNARYRNNRISAIREMVARHSPQAIVFYGRKYEPFWSDIAGVTFDEGQIHSQAVKGDVTFVSMHHPNARIKGKTSKYLEEIGAFLRR